MQVNRKASGFFGALRKALKVRKELPRELIAEFTAYKDINSIDRMHVTAWLAFCMSLLLFVLDYIRYAQGKWDENKQLLFYCHIVGLFFIIPAIHISRHKEWIISTRLRRGVVIWGMVVLTMVFILGQSVLVFLDRHSLVMYLALIFISGWMFAMSHKERLLFHGFTISVMLTVITMADLPGEIRIASYFELIFLTIVAFFFDAFDYNLRLSNFFSSKAIKEDQERIKKLEEFKSRFFTNLTHELRTPLTMISGMAQEIKNDYQRWAVEGADMIRRNAEGLLHLINQILDLSKIESGSMPVHWVLGDVVSFCGYAVDSFKGSASLKNIRLHFIPEEESIIMDHDPDKWLTIISNLISNAIRFTPPEGHIYIHMGIRKHENGSELEFIVRDTGIGINQEALEHVFERFYQDKNEFSEKGIGSGIGLSMVYELVRLMEGEISVKSFPGKGSQFTILFPIHREGSAISTSMPAGDHHAKTPESLTPALSYLSEDETENNDARPEVLVIEDNTDVMRYIQICLGDDYKMIQAADGQSGIEKAVDSIPDIIISDVMMPVKDGLEVCSELKSNPCTSHIPVILLSAMSDAASRIAGLEKGAAVYMLKPFEKGELRAQVHNLLEKRFERQARYADPSSLIEAPPDDRTAVEDEFVRKVKSIIYEHLDDSEFSIHHLCRKVFLSRTQLFKKLKALTGLSASAFIRQVRLFAALDLLKSTELTVQDVAYKTGFTDPNYFTRCFTQEFGKSPSETRK